MSNREVATGFLRCFCAGDLGGLTALLAEDLQLTGPFHQFSYRDACLAVLEDDPPEKSSYRILSVTEDEGSGSIYYDYEKSDGSLTVAQLFRFRD